MNIKIDPEKFAELAQAIGEIKALDAGEVPPPWASPDELKPDFVRDLIRRNESWLPVAYRDAYARPLHEAVDRLLQLG